MDGKHKSRANASNKRPRRAITVGIGVGWYTEQEWAKVKAAAVAPDKFEATYAEWIQMAERTLLDLRATGLMADKFSSLLTNCSPGALRTGSRIVPHLAPGLLPRRAERLVKPPSRSLFHPPHVDSDGDLLRIGRAL